MAKYGISRNCAYVTLRRIRDQGILGTGDTMVAHDVGHASPVAV